MSRVYRRRRNHHHRSSLPGYVFVVVGFLSFVAAVIHPTMTVAAALSPADVVAGEPLALGAVLAVSAGLLVVSLAAVLLGTLLVLFRLL